MKKKKADIIENESFEEKLNRLREIVKEMENGNLPLDDSLKLFEEGIKLYRNCNSIINEAEQRISILLDEGNGELKEKSFIDFEEDKDEL